MRLRDSDDGEAVGGKRSRSLYAVRARACMTHTCLTRDEITRHEKHRVRV